MNSKQILILELTSYCNSNCRDCLRANMMNEKKYMLKYEEICIVLDEIERFKDNFINFELKLSGGEPTIWKDGDLDIVDVMKECQNRNIKYSLVTNGKIFGNQKSCEKLYNKILLYNLFDIKMYITIDNFHENYNNGESNNILDNVLSYGKNINQVIFVQSTVTKIKSENISTEFIKKYSDRGIFFMMNPLLPWGKGEELKSSVPLLNLYTNEKDKLGDYEKYFYILGKAQKIWDTYDEFLKYDNFKAIKKLNCCGKTITFMEGRYYYCMPCSDIEDFCFATIGKLDYNKYIDFVEKNQFIQRMKNNNFNEEDLTEECPVGYGICALCKDIYIKQCAEYKLTNMNLETAKIISNWRYDGDYSVYNTKTYDELVASDSGLTNPLKKDNYICFWKNDTELIAYVNITKRPDNSVFIGIGLAPVFCGQGIGKKILKYSVEEAGKRYPKCKIKLQVRSWNTRAIKCYQAVGFNIIKKDTILDHLGEKAEFTFMEYVK